MKTRNETIEGKCDCGEVYVIHRNPEIPKNVTLLRWNWCPKCEDENGDCSWIEKYSYKRKPKIKNAQTVMDFLNEKMCI